MTIIMWEVSMAGTSSSGTWNLLGFLCSSNRCAQGHVCRQWNPLEQLLLWVWSQEHLLSLVPERATCNACWRRLRWQAPLLPSYQWFCWNTTLTLNQLQWNGRLWENKLPPNISLTSFPLVALLVSLLGFMGHFVLFFFSSSNFNSCPTRGCSFRGFQPWVLRWQWELRQGPDCVLSPFSFALFSSF